MPENKNNQSAQFTRREFLKVSGATIPALAVAGPAVLSSCMRKKKPNIVYILADQLRHDVFGFMGDEKAITPNFDRLADESMNFSNTVSVSPVCAPHRSSLFTGKYISSTGMVINETCINPNHKAIGYVLHDAGYNMGYLGKWHLVDIHTRSIPQGPARLGFQHAKLWQAYNFNHLNYKGYYWTDEGDELVRKDIDGHMTDYFTNTAINFIKEQANQEEPFALFLSLSPPHDPWRKDNVPDHCYEKFKDVEFPHPPNFKSEPDQYADREKSNERWEYWDKVLPEQRRSYYAMVNHIDEKLGEIMKALKETGIEDETIFVYTSDHGEMFGAQGRVYKLTFYEEAARVPFLIRWPGQIKPGSESDACLNTPDIAPTLLGLAGLDVPNEMEGMDLSNKALLKYGDEPECAFMQGMGHTYRWIDGSEWRAIRTKQHTYARYLVDGSEHLYDNLNDPFQNENLAGHDEHQDILIKLRKMMSAKMESLNDKFLKCSEYRAWMSPDDEYSIVASARGTFNGPHQRIESIRHTR